MSMSDPIADMLTRIRNGQSANMKSVSMPSSRQKKAIAKVLLDEGYISGFTASEEGKPVLTVALKYYLGTPVIEELKRISRPGLRIYRSKTELPIVNNGLGISIISTSRGVMSDKLARAAGQGGEVICTIS
ncbi:MAG: 30S ribosomal protein S8 [Thiothrix sp.]|nr:MAG: 30S ribosomal protein S8 [Thiothrix sp.]